MQAQRGFTLTELAVVLCVIGGLVGAIWFAAGSVSTANKSQKSIGQIMQVYAGYKSFYGRHGLDTNDCTPTMAPTDVTCNGVKAGFFPPEMLQPSACSSGNQSGSYPLTPWGNGSYATVQTCQTSNTIMITYSNLSQASCNALANTLYNSSALMTYQAIYNGTSGGGTCPNSPAGWNCNWLPPVAANTPWTSAQISANCGANTGNAVQIGLAVQ